MKHCEERCTGVGVHRVRTRTEGPDKSDPNTHTQGLPCQAESSVLGFPTGRNSQRGDDIKSIHNVYAFSGRE